MDGGRGEDSRGVGIGSMCAFFICKAAQALKDNGAKKVIGAATHPILSGKAIERLNESVFEEVIVTNTLPIAEEALIPKLTVLSIAPIMAAAIEAVYEDGSVTTLFK